MSAALTGSHQGHGLALAGGHHDALDLADHAECEAEPGRLRLAAESQLLDIPLDVPSGMRAVLEEDDVAGTIAGRAHVVVLEHDPAFQYQDGLVEIIIPVELARGALPDDRRSEAIGTPRQLARRRFRLALDDPGRRDWPWCQLHIELANLNQPPRHRNPPANDQIKRWHERLGRPEWGGAGHPE